LIKTPYLYEEEIIMMRSLFSGVSGLRAHQQKMDVIGNNIANVNTVGYKAQRVTFSDMLYQSMSSATAADAASGRGGQNGMQIGMGTQVSSIDSLMGRGSAESTGNSTDLAINGNGFFIVRNGETGSYMFTRAGNFSVDENGNLVTSDGFNVYGWTKYEKQADGSYKFNANGSVEPINIYSDTNNGNKKVLAAKASDSASFNGKLDSSEKPQGSGPKDIGDDPEAQYTTTMTVYDSLGNKHEVKVNFTKCYVDTTDPSKPVTTWYYSVGDASDTDEPSHTGFLSFDNSGKLIKDSSDTTPTVNFTLDSSSGAASFDVKLDFSNLTSTSGDSSVETGDVNGYGSGTLEDISIDANGIIMGVYSNGQQQPVGMLALAQFDNPAGLERKGSNYFMATANSGDFSNGVPADGSLSPGSLEMSNVDLSYEFSQMIITQRGYQANSKIITTSDEMLETLINIKR
jgi:flagellar hook protein FlgE